MSADGTFAILLGGALTVTPRLRGDIDGARVLAADGGVTVDADVTDESYDISATVISRGILNLFERTDIDANASGTINGTSES